MWTQNCVRCHTRVARLLQRSGMQVAMHLRVRCSINDRIRFVLSFLSRRGTHSTATSFILLCARCRCRRESVAERREVRVVELFQLLAEKLDHLAPVSYASERPPRCVSPAGTIRDLSPSTCNAASDHRAAGSARDYWSGLTRVDRRRGTRARSLRDEPSPTRRCAGSGKG